MGQFGHLNVADLSAQDARAAVAVAIAAGTLYCFLGYRMLRFVIGLTGFTLAGAVAAALAGWATEGNVLAMVAAGILGGMAGSFALFLLYNVGVFCLGVLGGALIAHTVLGVRPDAWVTSAIFGAGIFGGLTALFLERLVMTVATATIGAWLMVYGLAFFVLGSSYFQQPQTPFTETDVRYALLVGWTVLAGAGTVVQYVTHKPKA